MKSPCSLLQNLPVSHTLSCCHASGLICLHHLVSRADGYGLFLIRIRAAAAGAAPAANADSDPESGEIEGEVGGAAAAADTVQAEPAANGVKSDRRRSSSRHKSSR